MNGIPNGEKRIVWRLFLYSFAVATSYIIARTVGDSLFLSRVGNEQLGLVFVIAGCSTAFVASGWFWLTRNLSISKSIQLSGLIFSALSLAAWFLLPSYHHSFWLMAAIYLLAEIRGCVNAINVVSALNAKLGRRSSKSSWAYVGLAAPLAGVLVGSTLAIESSVLSLRTWILIGFVFDFASVGIGYLLQGLTKKKAALFGLKSSTSVSGGSKKYVRSDKFQFWIGILISTKVIVLTFVSFEWKTSVNNFFEGDAESLVQFFGFYYGLMGIATVVTQYLLTSTLLKNRALRLPILLMPVVLLVVSMFLIMGVGLLVAMIVTTAGKSVEIWRRSVHDTTLNTLYTKIKRQQRRSAIAFNSAIVKPFSEVAAACVIFFGTSLVYRPAMLFVILLWTIAGIRLIRLVQTTKSGSTTKARSTEERSANSKLGDFVSLLNQDTINSNERS